MDEVENIKLDKALFLNKFELYYPKNDIWLNGMVNYQYEPFESLLLLDQIKEDDIVIDVGANIGYYSLLMASKLGPKGKVYAFEPDPVNRSILEKNVKINRLEDSIIISDLAVYDRIGNSKLYLSDTNMGDHRLFLDQNERGKRHEMVVNTTTLDVFWNSINRPVVSLIKIDTQGCEPYVIQGGAELIQSCHPDLFFEYWPYGYQQAGANFNRMKEFLKEVYRDFYFIDRGDRRLFTVQDKFLERFCQLNQGTMHADLICTFKPIDQWISHLFEKENLFFMDGLLNGQKAKQ